MSARYITVMYHSPNRWGESHKTVVTLIKAKFLTLIVGNQARRCDDVPPAVLQPPEILKASMLWDNYITNLHLLFDSHQHASVPYRLSTRLITIVILSSEKKQLNRRFK